MPTIPRLKGRALAAVRRLAEQQPFRAAARHQVVESFGLQDLLTLPDDARSGFDESPTPVRGRGEHGWDDAGHEPPSPPDFREAGARLREAYQSGELTPLEVFDRIAGKVEAREFGELVHSPFVTLDMARAREAAEASTERYRNGEPLGPLDGIPVPIKDHHDMEGLPTGNGTSYLIREAGPAEKDSALIARLRDAGAILYAKAHTTEWGLQPTGFNANEKMPRNPYDRGRGAGGSSTGTAAAIACGLAPAGLGSDGGGSIRIPSASCGIFGLKPTFQRIGRTGDHWGGTMHHNGPLGQSTTDLVDFMAAAGSTPYAQDPATQMAPDVDDLVGEWRAALGRGVEGCRIGIWDWGFDVARESIARPVWTALRALEREGAELVDLTLDYSEFHQPLGALTLGVESSGLLFEILENHRGETGDDVGLMTAVLSTMRGREYILAQRTRAVLRRKLAEAFGDVDLIASPTANMLAPEYPLADDLKAIYDEDAIQRLCEYAFLANLTGLPVGTLPVGLAGGLPVGMQLVGDAWDEASVFAAMAHCERLGITGLPKPSEYLRQTPTTAE